MVKGPFRRYTVKPFSNPRYYDNMQKVAGGNCCAICGKEVKVPVRWAAVVDRPGKGVDWTTDPDTETAQPDIEDLGCWPVGNDCHRKYKSEEG